MNIPLFLFIYLLVVVIGIGVCVHEDAPGEVVLFVIFWPPFLPLLIMIGFIWLAAKGWEIILHKKWRS